MAEPENMTLVLLRELRARMEDRFDKVDQRFDANDARFDALEKKIDVINQAAFAESILGRYAVTEVEERLAAIEARLAALEGPFLVISRFSPRQTPAIFLKNDNKSLPRRPEH